MNNLLPLYIIFPLACAFLIPILNHFIKGIEKAITSVCLLCLTSISIYLIIYYNDVVTIYAIGGWSVVNMVPVGIFYILDGFSLFILLITNLLGFISAFYSISYIEKYHGTKYFFCLFCLMVAGMNGVVLSGDIFNLYVFLEIAAIASYALVAFGVGKEELEASFKYQILGGLGSILIIFGIALLYWQTKTLNIPDIATKISDGHQKTIIFIQLVLITGFGLKAAIIPFHAWLPDAHSSAPSPISAMLSGVLIKAIGIYVIIRLFFNMFNLTYEIALLITILGTLSMLIGVFLAIGQWDIKRLLAYHSISQMGYVIMGIGIGMLVIARNGNEKIAMLSILGGLYHLINHAVFKGLLFLNAGAVEYSTGTRNLKELGGLSEKMPVTSTTSLTASMAISGIPPFNGFFSKLIIILASIKAGYYGLGIIAVIVSIITLASFMKLQRYTFYNKTLSSILKIREVPFTMCFSMIILAILCLGLSLLIIPGLRDMILTPAVNALLDNLQYTRSVINI